MHSAPSTRSRAVITLGLVFGFYALAFVISGLLLYIPYAEWLYLGRVHGKLALGCIGGAGIILWSILPRPDRFTAPGPLLDAESQPRLFEKLRIVAQATGQQMPAEVYLIPEVNAWVAERGGIAGWGSRRVMGLGLPLMQVLTVLQLQAVLAHEFGHYYGGDTKLGPWIYKTRAAMARTLINLAERDSVLQVPFALYGNMFLKVTHAVSRQQEYAADALAARTIGARPLGEALRVIHGAGNAFEPFMHIEVVPLLDYGFRPPIAVGFARFLTAPPIAEAVSKSLEHDFAESQTDPFDTHPPLGERLRALQGLAQGEAMPTDHLAVDLLSDLDNLEKKILRTVNPQADIDAMQTVSWDETGGKALLPIWRDIAVGAASALHGVTPAAFPALAGSLIQFGRKLVDKNQLLPFKELSARAEQALTCALVVALINDGWSLRVEVGEAVRLERQGKHIEPFGVISHLESGKTTAQEWLQRCHDWGIAELNLGVDASGATRS